MTKKAIKFILYIVKLSLTIWGITTLLILHREFINKGDIFKDFESGNIWVFPFKFIGALFSIDEIGTHIYSSSLMAASYILFSEVRNKGLGFFARVSLNKTKKIFLKDESYFVELFKKLLNDELGKTSTDSRTKKGAVSIAKHILFNDFYNVRNKRKDLLKFQGTITQIVEKLDQEINQKLKFVNDELGYPDKKLEIKIKHIKD